MLKFFIFFVHLMTQSHLMNKLILSAKQAAPE
jgi:hypothetical protein